MDSKALTKVQSTALIAIVVVAAVGGGASYVWWRASLPPPEDIRIGICADIDMTTGKGAYRGAELAAEEINAGGGILGRNVTIVAEDNDAESGGDLAVAVNSITRLITVDKADYVIIAAGNVQVMQDVCAEHRKILFSVYSINIEDTQRVLDNYGKYKYFFRIWQPNSTSTMALYIDSLLTLRNYTGFSKVAFLVEDRASVRDMATELERILSDLEFEIVYHAAMPSSVTDFTSYLAAIEESGAEILYPISLGQPGTSLVKEYYDRQSPFVLWGQVNMATDFDFWNITDGKCESITVNGNAITAGYALTSKTLPTRDAFLERWGTMPRGVSVSAYDLVRFILPDAIRRAGTTETEAVIKALETTNVETSMARHFVFTSSHDVMVGEAGPTTPGADHVLIPMIQWQNGTQVIVYPEKIMKEAGATYVYPHWQGSWSK